MRLQGQGSNFEWATDFHTDAVILPAQYLNHILFFDWFKVYFSITALTSSVICNSYLTSYAVILTSSSRQRYSLKIFFVRQISKSITMYEIITFHLDGGIQTGGNVVHASLSILVAGLICIYSAKYYCSYMRACTP